MNRSFRKGVSVNFHFQNSGNESEDEKPEKLTPAVIAIRRTTERETEKAKGAKEETTTAQEDDEQVIFKINFSVKKYFLPKSFYLC